MVADDHGTRPPGGRTRLDLMASTYSGRWRVVTYLTPEDGERVEQRAAARGLSVSKLLEELVTEGLAQDDAPVAS